MGEQTRKPIPQKVEVTIEVMPPNGEFERAVDLVKKYAKRFNKNIRSASMSRMFPTNQAERGQFGNLKIASGF